MSSDLSTQRILTSPSKLAIQEAIPVFMGLGTATVQEEASSFSGRTVVKLPVNNEYRKGWEILGVEWVESPDKNKFFANALLPEGWRIEDKPDDPNYRYRAIQRVIDGEGENQAEIWVKLDRYNKPAHVIFLKIDRALIGQAGNLLPVYYSGYLASLYCTYGVIINAIKSWGKVEAILMSQGGSKHTFIVRFHKSIKFSGFKERDKGCKIWDTPFELRGMYNRGMYNNCTSNCANDTDNAIVSRELIAFDIRYLETGTFGPEALWRTQRIVPDERLSRIAEEVLASTTVGEDERKKERNRKIHCTFSEYERAEKLLEWIERAGSLILEEGLSRSDCPIPDYSTEDVIRNYTTFERSHPWQVLGREIMERKVTFEEDVVE